MKISKNHTLYTKFNNENWKKIISNIKIRKSKVHILLLFLVLIVEVFCFTKSIFNYLVFRIYYQFEETPKVDANYLRFYKLLKFCIVNKILSKLYL